MKNNLIIKILLGAAALILLTVFLHSYIGKYGLIVLSILFVVAYASCIHLSGYGTDKMLELAACSGIKAKRVFLTVIYILSPFYLLLIAVALIPITSWEVWAITSFPAFFLTLIPLNSVTTFMRDTGISKALSVKMCYFLNLLIYLFLTAAVQIICRVFIY